MNKKKMVFLPMSLSAPVTMESESDLKELFQNLKLSLTWRSKFMQLPTLLRKWKKDYWIRALFGRISKNFHTKTFTEKLTSYQPGSLANLLVPQESEEQQKTRDTCIPGSQMVLPIWNQNTYSSKMSRGSYQQKQETENRYSNMSSETWKKEVTHVRGEYSQLVSLVLHTKESESLSSGEKWGTPNTMDCLPSRSYEAMKRQATNGGRKNRKRPGNLREQIDPLMCQAYEDASREANQHAGPPAPEKKWNTPQARDWKGAQGRAYKGEAMDLPAQVEKNWQTPQVGEEKVCLTGTQKQVMLSHQVQPGWATPVVRDSKNARQGDCSNRNRNPGQTLIDQTLTPESQAKNNTNGKNQERLQLNPRWVCQLMGLKAGWMNLGSWGTEFVRTLVK